MKKKETKNRFTKNNKFAKLNIEVHTWLHERTEVFRYRNLYWKWKLNVVKTTIRGNGSEINIKDYKKCFKVNYQSQVHRISSILLNNYILNLMLFKVHYVDMIISSKEHSFIYLYTCVHIHVSYMYNKYIHTLCIYILIYLI